MVQGALRATGLEAGLGARPRRAIRRGREGPAAHRCALGIGTASKPAAIMTQLSQVRPLVTTRTGCRDGRSGALVVHHVSIFIP